MRLAAGRVLGALGLAACAGCAREAAPSNAPWTEDRPYRFGVIVEAVDGALGDRPVVVPIARADGESPAIDAGSLTLIEIDAGGASRDAPPAFQYDAAPGGGGDLTLWLDGVTPAATSRRFLAYFGGEPSKVAGSFPQASVAGEADDRGHPALLIETDAGTWTFHTRGAGFAALVDPDGLDWLGWQPGGGAAGEYRGMPNLVYPEGYFHPGGDDCVTQVVASGPLRVRLESACSDGAWAAHWDVFPRHATLTVTRAAHPYWFLYEGTPGGSLEPDDDYCGFADGSRHPAALGRDGDLPAPEWLYFGDPRLPRVLWLAHHRDDEHPDAYYAMEGRMTVFGFGRRRTKAFIESTPESFSVGFHEGTDHEGIAAAAAAALARVRSTVGPIERRP